MAEESTTLYVLAAVCVVAVIGVGLSVASFATNESMTGMMGPGGPMMGGGGGSAATPGPGPLEWTVLGLSLLFLVLATVLLVQARGREARTAPPLVPNLAPATAMPTATAVPSVSSVAAAPAGTAVPETSLVKLLNDDERRMYLELREHGGAMLQRDLVALGIFSKAKVTRVLDKLEAKGVVVREAHGMTNRVRLTAGAAK